MTDGQWIALDVYFFSKPFPLRLRERFGAAGQLVFIAFLCACKQNRPQGEITFVSDYQALQKMSIEWLPLVNDKGEMWTLDEFWTFTGRAKQTKKTARGRVWNVKSSQFNRWQRTIDRDLAAERQRRWRAKNGRDSHRDGAVTDTVTNTVTDIDSDIDSSPYPHATTVTGDVTGTPQGAPPPAPPRSPRRRKTPEPELRPEPIRPPIPDWTGIPEPNEPTIDQAAVKALRHRAADS